MGNRLFMAGIIFLVLLALCFIFIVPLSNLFGIPLEGKEKLLKVFPGLYTILFGIFMIIFSERIGRWTARGKKRFAEKHPWWAKMSGLPPQRLEKYFSPEYNRKNVIVGAVVMIVVGIFFTIFGALF